MMTWYRQLGVALKKPSRFGLWLFAAGLVVTGAVSCTSFIASTNTSAIEPAQIQVRLLETSDLHAHLLGYDYTRLQPTTDYGLAHTAMLIQQARAERANTLLFDNGDLLQGSALGDWAAEQIIQGKITMHPVIAALNYLKFDAANLGNHEFNFGLDFLEKSLAGAKFPYVSANVYSVRTEQNDEELQADMRTQGWHKPFVQPYALLERTFVDQNGHKHPIKVGVIGFVPPQIMVWDASHVKGRLYVRDMVAAAQYFVPKMQAEGADFIVALAHTGMNEQERYSEFTEQATRQLAQVPGIQAILFGHQHRLFPATDSYQNFAGVNSLTGEVYGVPAVSPGYWGSHLGVIDLTLQKTVNGWQVIEQEVAVRPITAAFDQGLVRQVQTAHQATVQWLEQPLVQITTPINSFFARVFPDSSTSFINAAQTWYGEQLKAVGELPAELPILSAAAPFRSGFQGADDYTNISAGEITLRHLSDIYVYPNLLYGVRVTGAMLREWLEMSALAFNQLEVNRQEAQPLFSRYPSFNFDVISGLEYAFDVTQPPRYNHNGELINPQARRVIDLTYQQQPIKSTDEFIVMVNNYRAVGGGNFPYLNGETIIYQGTAEVREIIANFAQFQAQTQAQMLFTTEQNWQLYSPVSLTALIRTAHNSAAKAEASEHKNLFWLHTDEKNYSYYQLKLMEK